MAAVSQLLVAIRANKPREVLAAIKGGSGVNSTRLGLSPLICAIQNGRPELVKLLLEHGADWAKRDRNTPWSPLMLATIQSYLPGRRHRPARVAKASRQIVTILRNAGARDPEADGVLGRVEQEESLIRSLAERGADAETKVFDADGVVILFPKRLERSAMGRFVPRLTLRQFAEAYHLCHLEAAMKTWAVSRRTAKAAAE